MIFRNRAVDVGVTLFWVSNASTFLSNLISSFYLNFKHLGVLQLDIDAIPTKHPLRRPVFRSLRLLTYLL